MVTTAVQEGAARAQIAATERIHSIEAEQLQIMQRELELGAIAESDVVAQEVLLAQTAALLPPLRKQLAVQRDAPRRAKCARPCGRRRRGVRGSADCGRCGSRWNPFL